VSRYAFWFIILVILAVVLIAALGPFYAQP
jgi:hypothetical protein